MSFRRIQISLPSKWRCRVVGFLCDSDDPRDLGEDMVQVSVPTGVRIEAGWYPESSPDGIYRVSVHSGRNPKVIYQFALKDVDETAQAIRNLAEHLLPSPGAQPTPIFEVEDIEESVEPRCWDAYEVCA